MGERRGVYRVSVGRPTRKRKLGRPRCRLDLQEVGFRDMDWIDWHRIGTGGGHL